MEEEDWGRSGSILPLSLAFSLPVNAFYPFLSSGRALCLSHGEKKEFLFFLGV
jgi:hypothetical protein